jgi:hypothetical protein
MPPEGEPVTPAQWRNFVTNLQLFAESKGEWAGAPIPISSGPLVLEQRYPFQGFQGLQDHQLDVVFGFDRADVRGKRCFELCQDNPDLIENCEVINSWYCQSHQATILVFKNPDGRVFHGRLYNANAENRLWTEFKTVQACGAWRLEAEERAISKLKNHICVEAYERYSLTGGFTERSERSGIIYWFRRLRPTVALSNTLQRGGLRALVSLCLHPIGYYGGTYAGVMVPTDDVLAHLLLMRADEHYFWRKCNQHPISSPQSGV